MAPPSLSDLLPQPGWAGGLLEEWRFPAGLGGGAPEQRGRCVSLSQGKQKAIMSQRTNSSGLEKDQGEGEMGRVMGRSRGSMEAGCPREGFRGLVISERISAAGCAPAAPFPHLTRAPVVLSTWGGGQGCSARGCGNMGPARAACDQPAAREPGGHCQPFVPPSLSFPPSGFFLPLLPSRCVCSTPPTFHPQFLA